MSGYLSHFEINKNPQELKQKLQNQENPEGHLEFVLYFGPETRGTVARRPKASGLTDDTIN